MNLCLLNLNRRYQLYRILVNTKSVRQMPGRACKASTASKE
jgi:hypothetical protein